MERRRHERVCVEIPAEIEIYIDSHNPRECTQQNSSGMRGLVNTIDVSLGGFTAKVTNSPSDTEKSFGPATAYTLVGKIIMGHFPDNAKIIRRN